MNGQKHHGFHPYLDAWVDFDRDGNWNDDQELVYSGAVVSGSNEIEFSVPQDAAVGMTFARFRLHDGTTGLAPGGESSSGEVEDYRLSITHGEFNANPIAGDDDYHVLGGKTESLKRIQTGTWSRWNECPSCRVANLATW